jgi:hypothetical protein
MSAAAAVRTDGAIKIAFAVVLTALITGSTAYFGQEARQTALIETHSTQLDRTADQIEMLIAAQQELIVEQHVLISRFDAYITLRERRDPK